MVKTIDLIRAYRVAAVGKRASEGRDSETYKAKLAAPQPITAYVKFCLDTRQPIAEIAASQLGRALGLNIPEPFLVFVDTARLPAASEFFNTGPRWTFASAQYGKSPMSVEHLYRSDFDTYQRVMNRWDHYEKTAAFDEWLANEDRNYGNLVFSGEKKTLALIDHGRCLASTYWPESLSNPGFSVGNNLVDGWPNMGDTQKARLRAVCNELMRDCALIDFAQFDRSNSFARIDAGTDKAEIIEFLTQRIHLTVSLLCQRIGMPELISTTH